MNAKYAVEFNIKVVRTDNKMLTNDENAMVEKMRVATHKAIQDIMAEHGQQVLAKKDKTVIF
jgi:hypothetical protein